MSYAAHTIHIDIAKKKKKMMLNLFQILQELNINETFFSLLQPSSFTLLVVPIFLIFVYKWSSTTPTDSPPSPPKLPIIGNLHQLGLYPHLSLQALSQRYGPLMLLHFGSMPVLVVSSAEAASEVMKTHDLAFSNRPKLTVFKKLLYNYKTVSTAPYGEYWRQMKSICVLNLLSNKRVRSGHAVREEELKSMISNIKQSSSVVNLSELFMILTNDVVCRVALGRKYSVGEGESVLKEIMREYGELLGAPAIGDYIPWLAWLNHVNGFNARLEKAAKKFDDFLDIVVQEHMDSSKSGNDGHVHIEKEDDQKDFVDVLLGIQKENLLGFPIDKAIIKAIIFDMFGAGTDTTYTLLEWAMAELLRHPRVMNKLQNEVRGKVGNRTEITEDDLVGMHYLKAVIKETLRLHPPLALLFPRSSTQDVKIHGYKIKANTQVLTNAWQIQRDPKSYNKPEEFEPERFMNSRIDYKGNNFELIPFGSGRRGCPGIQFSIIVGEIALASIVHNFNWALPGGARLEDLDMTESSGLTTHRKYPLKVVATPFSC